MTQRRVCGPDPGLDWLHRGLRSQRADLAFDGEFWSEPDDHDDHDGHDDEEDVAHFGGLD